MSWSIKKKQTKAGGEKTEGQQEKQKLEAATDRKSSRQKEQQTCGRLQADAEL